MKNRKSGWPWLVLASTAALGACGGGGGSSSPNPPPPGSTLTLSGVVSVGPAVASMPVQITCATGSATATTAADGSYSAGISSGVLPCVLRTTTSTGSPLHSVAAGDTAVTSASANITPITELVTANVANGDPETLSSTFDATAQAKVTPTTVATAIATTTAALAGNVDLSATNPLTDPLVVSTSGSAGNTADQKIDQLVTAIAATQTTLAAVTSAVATATPSTAPVLPTLAPTATSCAALRSGLYRYLSPHESSDDPSSEAQQLTIDAVALTATDSGPGDDGAVTPLTAVAGSPCRFTYADTYGTGTVLVSTGGMMVVRSPSVTGPIRTSFIVPMQDVPLAQLAGTWNYVTYSRTYQTPTDPLLASNGSAVIDGSGDFVSGTVCRGAACIPATAGDLPQPMTVDPAGGFDSPDDVGPDRIFVAIADNGAKTLFILFPGEGGIAVLTQQQALTMPAVGDVAHFWDFTVGSGAFENSPANDAQGGASALVDDSFTVTAINNVSQSYTRQRASDQFVDTPTINDPGAGTSFSAATGGAGASFSMPLVGFGVTLSTNGDTSTDYLEVSIDHF